jgi:hypothetical protein
MVTTDSPPSQLFKKPLEGRSPPSGVAISVTREKPSMAKGKPQQIGMNVEINSIPIYSI